MLKIPTPQRYSSIFGPTRQRDGSVSFRLWAPESSQVTLFLPESEQSAVMETLENGFYQLTLPNLADKTLYRFDVTLPDGNTLSVPDPASRYQPQDVHGPSMFLDTKAFQWEDTSWKGRPWEETVIYELHVGTFTPEGTFAAIEKKLDYFLDLGVTAIELMPVADFPGARNWGYDGVLLFAPDSRYGTPDDLKSLVQAAHKKGLMVFLDVVYNHFGPDGNYLYAYAKSFFTDRHKTPWGDAINFDGAHSDAVRAFFVENALYWLNEFHFDGLRFDAVQAIKDDSATHILAEIAQAVKQGPALARQIHLMLEDDDNVTRFLQSASDGTPEHYTAEWNDDLHHVLHVMVSGEQAGYYRDYVDNPIARLARALTEGFVYQGEVSAHRNGKHYGEASLDLPLTRFISFVQNHDQVGNRAFGDRITAKNPLERVMLAVAVNLLSPQIPLLFMGEEWASSQPFPFFCDFGPELSEAVTKGRRQEFAKFPEFNDPEKQARIPDPCLQATFDSAHLNWNELEQEPHRPWWQSYRQLLTLRQAHVVPFLKKNHGVLDGVYETLSQDALKVVWKQKDQSAHIGMLLNFSDSPIACPAPTETIFYSTSPQAAERLMQGQGLAAYSAVWFKG